MENTLDTHFLRVFLMELVMFKSYVQSDQQAAKLKVLKNTQKKEANVAKHSFNSVIEEQGKLKNYKKSA